MGKIIRNGIEFSSTVDTANNISYDNSLSGLEATTTQKAIDEVVENISTLNESLNVLSDDLSTYTKVSGTFTAPTEQTTYINTDLFVLPKEVKNIYVVFSIDGATVGSATKLVKGSAVIGMDFGYNIAHLGCYLRENGNYSVHVGYFQCKSTYGKVIYDIYYK